MSETATISRRKLLKAPDYTETAVVDGA